MVVFSLKSWVIAMPIEAKANEVRSQARNVRSAPAGNVSSECVPRSSVQSRRLSTLDSRLSTSQCKCGSTKKVTNQEQGGLVRHFLCYPALHFHTCPPDFSTIPHPPRSSLRSGSMTDFPASSQRYDCLSMDPGPHSYSDSDSMSCHNVSILLSPFRQLA